MKMNISKYRTVAGFRNPATWAAVAFFVVLLPLGFMFVESITRPRRILDEHASVKSSAPMSDQTPVSEGIRGETNFRSLGRLEIHPENPAAAGKLWSPDQNQEAETVSQSEHRLDTPDDSEEDFQYRPLSVIVDPGKREDVPGNDDFVSIFLGSNGDAAKTGSIAAVIQTDRDTEPGPGHSGRDSQPLPSLENEKIPGPTANRTPVAIVRRGVLESHEAPDRAESAKPAPHPQPSVRERVEVTIIRPRKTIVKQNDEVIGRCRTEKGFAIVLVKPCHVGAYWWVQQSVPRQTGYFRARIQFGNDSTPSGSRFRVVVAFVPEGMEIPDAGTQFRELPLELKLSQNLEFTLKRD